MLLVNLEETRNERGWLCISEEIIPVNIYIFTDWDQARPM